MQDHRAADIVAVYLYVGVGVRYERPDQLGYSHFQEHMLFKGTDKWGPGYIDRAVEGVGGRTNATTSFDFTDFYIVVPEESHGNGDADARRHGVPLDVRSRRGRREREVIFEEANIETDNPKTAIIRQLYGMVFADNPYGYPVLGTRATMDAATSAILKAYNKKYYTPENMTLVVAGPVDVKTVRGMVDRIWGVIPSTGYKPRRRRRRAAHRRRAQVGRAAGAAGPARAGLAGPADERLHWRHGRPAHDDPRGRRELAAGGSAA